MARTGLEKSEVRAARDALLAQGRHPSVDAVRIALGNTGSKTTIHKYLKELEQEDGGVSGPTLPVTPALEALVVRLAAQLQGEANMRINEIQAQGTEKALRDAEALAALRQEVAMLAEQLKRVEAAMSQETVAQIQLREKLQSETIARHMAEQQVIDLKERLAEKNTSIEQERPVRELQLQLAAALAKLGMQQTMTAELRMYLAQERKEQRQRLNEPYTIDHVSGDIFSRSRSPDYSGTRWDISLM